jgi:hypothetical protein
LQRSESGQERTKVVEPDNANRCQNQRTSNYTSILTQKLRYPLRQREIIEAVLMFKPIRSRSDKAIGDTVEGKWTIVAKRIIAEPTPRTPYDAPRLGIYDYEVVPSETLSTVTS